MVAPATAAASDNRVRAKAHLESTLAFLASAKNTPVHARDFSALANSLVARADEARLRQIVQTRVGPVAEALAGSLAESLDWIAARNVITFFAMAAGRQLTEAERAPLAAELLLATKGSGHRPSHTLRWPDAAAIDAAAHRLADDPAPYDATRFQSASLSAFSALEVGWIELMPREGG